MKFYQMGGVGILDCLDCKHSEEVHSVTHGDGHTIGYQCRNCGKFAARSYQEPFATPNTDIYDIRGPLENLPREYWPGRIEFAQFMVRVIEKQMQKRPKEQWFASWEPDLAMYRARINSIPVEELDRIRNIRRELDAAYKASLFCECGGPLDGDAVLFCPVCRSKRLSYKMTYIT